MAAGVWAANLRAAGTFASRWCLAAVKSSCVHEMLQVWLHVDNICVGHVCKVNDFLTVLYVLMTSKRVARTVERLATSWDGDLNFLANITGSRAEVCQFMT
jgi:hypothetical protein